MGQQREPLSQPPGGPSDVVAQWWHRPTAGEPPDEVRAEIERRKAAVRREHQAAARRVL